MGKGFLRIVGIIVVLWVLLVSQGCGASGSEKQSDYLIRVGDRKITERDFRQAFELAKTAYPQSTETGSSDLQGARQKVLDEMTIELIMLKHSDELGISISEAELEDAVAALTADYPPGVFDQTLIESAVPFEAWKQRLRIRLLMEKLMNTELRDQVVILPEDVESYYSLHYKGKAGEADSDNKFERLKKTIVADLRRKKMEEAYGAWISGLKQKYPIEVNQTRWEQFLKEASEVEGGSEVPAASVETKAPGN